TRSYPLSLHDALPICRADRLKHGLLGAHALEHGVRPDTVREFFGAGHTRVAALCHYVRSAELASEALPRLVAAHRDDSPGAQLRSEERRVGKEWSFVV